MDTNIQFINQNEISECLSKTSLVVSDFSSIIFDLMYRNKPFIIYIPDGNDPTIEDIYKYEYYELIQGMKNGSIYFENKFFNVKKTITSHKGTLRIQRKLSWIFFILLLLLNQKIFF